MQDALLKLQVKNKLLHSRKTGEVDWQLKPPEESEARLQWIANSPNIILPVCTNCPSSNSPYNTASSTHTHLLKSCLYSKCMGRCIVPVI